MRSNAVIPQAKLHRPSWVLLLLLAFCFRIYHLDDQALRGDEAATVHYAALPVGELWQLARLTDPHPPLYYLLLQPWQGLIGDGAWVMRFAGVAASLSSIALLYRLSRQTLRRTGLSLLAAGLLALNPLHIWLAQDLRSYPFFTLLGLLSSWALWRALHPAQTSGDRRQESTGSRHQTNEPVPAPNRGSGLRRQQPTGRPPQPPKPSQAFVLRNSEGSPLTQRPPPAARRSTFSWLLYIILTVACLYIHYYTVFLITFQGLFVLLNARRFWPQKWPWLASQVAIGLLILPGLQLASAFIGQAAGGIEALPLTEILGRTSAALLTGFTLDAGRSLWLSLLLTPIWLTGLVVLLRRDFTPGSFWLLFCAVPVLGVIALSIDRPFFKERFLIQAQPAFEVLLAAGFLALAKIKGPGRQPSPSSNRLPAYLRRPPAYVSLLLVALLLYFNISALNNYFHDPAYAKAPPWYLYHDYVSDHARPDGDVMLTNFPEAAVSYYSPDELPFYVVPDERDLPVAVRLEAAQAIAAAYERIWFLPLLRQGFDEQGDVLHWLDRHADRVNQVFFPDYNINLYLSPPAIEARMIRRPAAFAHGVRLRGYQIFDEQGRSRLVPLETGDVFLLTTQPGDEFTLSLYWQSEGPTAAPHTVFTHLIAADGFNRTGQDNQPVWGTYPTTAWQPDESITDKYTLTLPPGAPPGDHRLRIGWYQTDSNERIPMVDETGRPIADDLELDIVVRVENARE